MQKRNKIAIGVFILFYVCFGVYVTLFQERIVYQPWPQDFETCEAFRDADKVIHNGTRMYVKEGARGTVVLYHGNAGSACLRDIYADEFTRADYRYVIVEYAGYSNDGRSPSHDLVKQDVQNVISYLEEIQAEHIVVVGESVGTGAASYHTSLQAPDNLLLISPFASLADVAQRKFWFYPTFALVDNAFDNMSLLEGYTGPVTILHGDNDRIISQKSGLRLYESLKTKHKTFVSVQGRGHNDLLASTKPFEVIEAVLLSPAP